MRLSRPVGRSGCRRRKGFYHAAAFVLVLAIAASSAGPVIAEPECGAGPKAASYVLSIVPTNATKRVDASSPQKSATYGFQVKNTGDSSLPYPYLQLFPWNFPPEEWSYNFVPSVPFEVEPNEPSKTVLLVIYPAADAEAKRYTFQLKGVPEGSTNSLTINLDILQYGGVLVKAPPAQAARPGETLEFLFEIVNTGNGKDRFFIESIETSVPALQPYLKDNNNWTPDLAPGKSAFKTVVVPLPFDLKTTEGSAGLQLSMSVRSNFNSSKKDVNWTLLQVFHIYDLSMGVSPPSDTLFPGEQAVFTVTVLNLGNGKDNVNLNLTSNFDASGWTVNLQSTSFLLPAGRSNSTKLKITPPQNALRGSNYNFEIAARSSGALFPETPVERTETVTIQVLGRNPPRPDRHIVVPGPVRPGQALSLPFNLTNPGNGEELVNITVLEKPEGWTALLAKSENLRVPPFSALEAVLLVQVPVDSGKAGCGSHLVRLRAEGSNGGPVVNLTFELTVGPVYDWTLGVAGNATARVNPYQNGGCSFALELQNTGNTKDDLELELSGGPAGWATLGTTALALGFGQAGTVRLEVRVPRTAEAGSDHRFRVTARSQNEPSLYREAEVSVAVASVDLAVVPAGMMELNDMVWTDLHVKAGGTVEIGLSVQNYGTDTAPAASVRFYDNGVLFAEKNTSAIRPLRTSLLTVSWASNLTGEHILRAEVDPGNRLGEYNMSNNGASCVVEVLEREVPPPPPPPVNWQVPLALAAACAATGMAILLRRRRSREDRELYESIYGKG